MKAKPQGRLEGTILGKILKTKFAVIASNWVFQGMRYMNIFELVLKLLVDVIFSLVLFMFIFTDTNLIISIFISIVMAHTVNWIINGHFFVLMRYITPVPKTEKQFDDFINKMKDSALKWKSIDGVAIYGSYCRGTMHELSDLDVRIITSDDPLDSTCGAFFCFYQRFVAFFSIFPLDIYLCNNMSFLDQLRNDETPFILIDHSGRLADRYGIDGTGIGV